MGGIVNNKLYIILVIIWVMIICYLSSETAEISSERSSYVTTFINQYMPDITDNNVRKTAHLVIYTVLGILLMICFRNSSRSLLYANIVGVTIGILDEFHQYFVPGRAMLFTDILINGLGY